MREFLICSRCPTWFQRMLAPCYSVPSAMRWLACRRRELSSSTMVPASSRAGSSSRTARRTSRGRVKRKQHAGIRTGSISNSALIAGGEALRGDFLYSKVGRRGGHHCRLHYRSLGCGDGAGAYWGVCGHDELGERLLIRLALRWRGGAPERKRYEEREVISAPPVARVGGHYLP